MRLVMVQSVLLDQGICILYFSWTPPFSPESPLGMRVVNVITEMSGFICRRSGRRGVETASMMQQQQRQQGD